jgi:multidrug efflux pump subunit AcrA (membrane-fusion protein)
MKKYSLIIIGAVVVVVVLFFTFKGTGKSEINEVILPVKSGKFIVDITTTGELEAKNSVKIQGPTRLREFRIYNVTINDIIPEGTVVKKGEWIANLDRSEFNTKLQDQQIELEQAQSQYIQTQLDTALQMRQARDELINLEYAVEEAELVLEQSAYEPPATVKQNEINWEKAKRNFQQAKDNYVIKFEQNKAKMADVAAELRKSQRELNSMMELANSFTVFAPEDGMVIYAKGWDGKAIKAGSQINSWDPTVATLPDLTTMVSKTYINEVDVRKITSGQQVEIGLDAFPEKKLTGIVTNIANVGEQRPNSDAKVFEAIIEIQGTDPMLKPSMTTSNRIITSVLDTALYIPLECLHSKDDSISYVFVKKGIKKIKQEIQLGGTNNNEAVVNLGLEAGDRVYLSVPSGMDDEPIALLPELDGKRNIKEEPKLEEKPKERVITLPDGRKITVPADGRPGGMRRMRQGGQQNQDDNKPAGTSEGEKKVEEIQDNTQKSETPEQKEGSSAGESEETSGQSS